ncbi:MAG: TetR/AcrR family transcriptional regulator [Deltaproteobacteria bacterium]|nr:TetR/AcrR family transcriptional regulator [Deltaproteobacteria bacterium]MBW2418213.1 TetR/AcrR family transcriptional regulator [Deltaproteobacteria bacterium]
MGAVGATTPTRRDRQRAATRERVFDAAMAEFRAVGFPNAQVDRIARAAGVVRGTFYFHFPSKEHVLIELEQRYSTQVASRLREMRGSEAGLRAVLSGVVDGIVGIEVELNAPELMRDLLGTFVRLPPPEEAADHPTPVLEELTHHFARAADAGELRSDLASDQLAIMVLTSVFGLLMSRRHQPEQRRADLEALMDVFVKGMRA